MSTKAQISAKIPAYPASTGARILQRKCACGGAAGLTGECPECSNKRLKLQRQAANHTEAPTVPPIVHDVLREPGQPLDTAIRAFMEPRFGHDFSRVRVHTDARSGESSRAVNALAYTVGHHIVFGIGQYTPHTRAGQKLLAHELTHVVQQASQPELQRQLVIGAASDASEREADRVADGVLDRQPHRGNAPLTASGRSLPPGVMQRAAIYTGRILDEGSCEHLACNSKYACEDSKRGITCPAGTRNASATTKYRPLFTCDTKCENNATCSDSDTWMAIPKTRFTRSKCKQDLVICANGKFTHAYVRDRSDREAWEVSHGIQDALGVSPYATFRGAIYGDENDPDFKKDSRCRSEVTPEPSATPSPSTSTSGEAVLEETSATSTSTPDAG